MICNSSTPAMMSKKERLRDKPAKGRRRSVRALKQLNTEEKMNNAKKAVR